MVLRTLTLLPALLYCGTLSAQDSLLKRYTPFYPVLRKEAAPAKARPYTPVLRNNLFLKGDTSSLPWPLAGSDTIPWRIKLKTVDIRANKYREDSLALRSNYGKDFTYRPPKFNDVVKFPLAVKNEGPDGKVRHELGLLAINLNLLDDVFARKRNAGKVKFRERLERYEQEKFNQQYYTAAVVRRFIPLRGDSLEYFTENYRPDNAFLRTATGYDLGRYIKMQYRRYLDSIKKAGVSTGP